MKKLNFLSSFNIYIAYFLYTMLIYFLIGPFIALADLLSFNKYHLSKIKNIIETSTPLMEGIITHIFDNKITSLLFLLLSILIVFFLYLVFKTSFKLSSQLKYKNFQLIFVEKQPYIKIFVILRLTLLLVIFVEEYFIYFLPSFVGNISTLLFFVLHVAFETYIFRCFLNRGIANKTIKLSVTKK